MDINGAAQQENPEAVVKAEAKKSREAKPVNADPSTYQDQEMYQIPTTRVPGYIYKELVTVAAAKPGNVDSGNLITGALVNVIRPALWAAYGPEGGETFEAWLERTTTKAATAKGKGGNKVAKKLAPLADLFADDDPVLAKLAELKQGGADKAAQIAALSAMLAEMQAS
jgi:hypothetical protein